jgi:uncharacterized protein
VNEQTSTASMSYEALSELLQSVGEVVQLPELHGGICGALVAGGPKAAELWLDESLDASPSPEQREADLLDAQRMASSQYLESLHAVLRASWQALEARELAFEPLLPDDEALLEEQVEALALWCHGFLSALGFSAPDVGARAARGEGEGQAGAAASVGEILSDFAEIARAGVSEEDVDGGQAEFALAELKEYVRASVQIVFEELGARRAAAARDMH